MTDFYAPYNFIPVTGKINDKPSAQTSWDEIAGGQSKSVRHDYWPQDLHNGRIVCQLTLETPTVVGTEQTWTDDEAKRVEAYRLNGQPAIPASSLRGMIGNIVESLSQSSLRVLQDSVLSVRKPVSAAIPAIGLLKKDRNSSVWELIPFTIPPITSNRGRFELEPHWKDIFTGHTWREVLPVYLDGYRAEGGRLTSFGFLRKKQPDSFVGAVPQGTQPKYYYAKLAGPDLSIEDSLPENTKSLKVRNSRLLGQQFAPDCSHPLTEEEYKEQGCPEGYTRGMIFAFGIESRETEIPNTKKHEYFIPRPKQTQRIKITDEAVKRFESLSEQQASESDNTRPFAPKGYNSRVLKSGRLIRFDINKKGEVIELSWSAIWRKLVDGSVHDFYSSISPDVTPWDPKRSQLTPAETLLGVTGDGKHTVDDRLENVSRNFASRVHFFDARSQEMPELDQEVTLKILASPKPPSPSMYFQRISGTSPIEKQDLSKTTCRPRGRKYYLHHPLSQINRQDWKTKTDENIHQKLKVTPLKAGERFWFHIDFHNLTSAELTLLWFSLCPDKAYRHRLGLGKPLGLGSIRIDIAGAFLTDRQARYLSTDLVLPRYQQVISEQPFDERAIEELTCFYPKEAEAITSLQVDTVAPHDTSLIDTKTLGIVNTLGNPANLNPRAEVHYPYTDSQQGQETEGFKWFVENDKLKTGAQALGNVKEGKSLPTLSTIRK